MLHDEDFDPEASHHSRRSQRSVTPRFTGTAVTYEKESLAGEFALEPAAEREEEETVLEEEVFVTKDGKTVVTTKRRPIRFGERIERDLQWYFNKYLGNGGKPLPTPSIRFMGIAAIASFIFIGILCTIAYVPENSGDFHVIISSFAAGAVLVYAAPESPLSQPRNVLFGHFFSCAIGIGCRLWIAVPMGTPALAFPVATALSVFVMQITSTVHPPAGGTTGFAVLATKSAADMGWALLAPCVVSSLFCILVGVVMNNFNHKARYPQYWFIESPPACKKRFTPPSPPTAS